MNRVVAMILAGGAGERLSVLTAERTKPAVPFGGLYRVIDFPISNCVNSGIEHIAVITQYRPRSLAEHLLGHEQRWESSSVRGKLAILQPYLGGEGQGWYKGTADAVYQNLAFVERHKMDEVLILAGDHIYIMNYEEMIDFHRKKDAAVTVGLVEVPAEDASRFGIVTLDRDKYVKQFEEKPKKPTSNLASMGIYVFNRDALMECLEEDACLEHSTHDFGRDILCNIVGKRRVAGYEFDGYWRDIGTVEAYWQANMDLVVDLPDLNLYGLEPKVFTFPHNPPPAKMGPRAEVVRSLVCNGAIVNGRVVNSVISDNVYIEYGAVISDSIVFSNTLVEKDAIVHRSIIDKDVILREGCHVGFGDDLTPNQQEPEHLNTGITVVGKGARVPAGTRIGRNVRIGCWVDTDEFLSDFIPSGSSIERKKPRRHRP